MINMKKGIAVRTMLLILIGMIVVGIMSYLIYRAATTKTLSVFECKAKLIDICRICENTGWDEKYMLDIDDTEDDAYGKIIKPCKEYPEFFYWHDNKDCSYAKWDCGVLMGTS
jgi:hypothetical protein